MFKSIVKSLFATKAFRHICEDTPESQAHLMKFLRELEMRAQVNNTNDENTRQFISLAEKLHRPMQMAAYDWTVFTQKYHCVITYSNEKMEKSRDFSIFLEERNVQSPNHWSYGFSDFYFDWSNQLQVSSGLAVEGCSQRHCH